MQLTVQVSFLLIVALGIFQLPMVGSYVLVMTLSLLLGLTGMMVGLVISSLCEEEREAMQLALGSFFPAQLLSGIIWPLEAVPMGLRYISYMLPTTWAAGAMRSIMSRGWGITEFDVWIGRFFLPLCHFSPSDFVFSSAMQVMWWRRPGSLCCLCSAHAASNRRLKHLPMMRVLYPCHVC